MRVQIPEERERDRELSEGRKRFSGRFSLERKTMSVDLREGKTRILMEVQRGISAIVSFRARKFLIINAIMLGLINFSVRFIFFA